MSDRFLPSWVGRTEAFFLRALLVLTVLWSLSTPSKYARLEDPAGLAKWGLPVTWIGQPGAHPWFLAAVVIFGMTYLLGLWRPGWLTFAGLGGMTYLHVGYWTLANSQGNTFHGSQMTSLVLVAQLAGWLVMRWREHSSSAVDARYPNLEGVLLYFSQCAIAGVYVTSAITKLLKSEGRWLLDSHYFAKSVQKVWRQISLDNPSRQEFTGVSPWAEWLLHHPMLARLLFAPGFFLEMFAFLILWNRAWAAGWGMALILMHVGIGIIMQLYFPEFEVLVLVFCLNVPYWLSRICRNQPGTLTKKINTA